MLIKNVLNKCLSICSGGRCSHSSNLEERSRPSNSSEAIFNYFSPMASSLISCRGFTAMLYLALGVAVAARLLMVLQSYPLFPIRLDDLPWTSAWFVFTVLDFYALSLCLSAIALASENNILVGLLWCAGFNLLGTTCILYLHLPPSPSSLPITSLYILFIRLSNCLLLRCVQTHDL